MSIILNVIDEVISASVDGNVLTKTFSEENFKELSKLAEAANNAASVADYKKAVEDFTKACQEDLNVHVESFCPNIYIKQSTGEYFLKNKGIISSIALPQVLVDRIKTSVDKKIDCTPLIKAWTDFLRNPKLRKMDKDEQKAWSDMVFTWLDLKYTNPENVKKLMEEKGYSEDVAIKLSTVYQVQFTQEGLVKAFKCSREITKRWEFDKDGNKVQVDMYPVSKEIDPITGLVTYGKPEKGINENRIFEPVCMGQRGRDNFLCSATGKEAMIYKVGAVHELSSWDKVDCNDNNSASYGLNCGNILYVKGWETPETETHNILISLADVGAVTSNSNLRVLRLYILDAFSGINGSLFHSSTYRKYTDEKWSDYRDEAIKHFGQQQDENSKVVNKEVEELKAI
jgi:hypothetical protein